MDRLCRDEHHGCFIRSPGVFAIGETSLDERGGHRSGNDEADTGLGALKEQELEGVPKFSHSLIETL